MASVGRGDVHGIARKAVPPHAHAQKLHVIFGGHGKCHSRAKAVSQAVTENSEVFQIFIHATSENAATGCTPPEEKTPPKLPGAFSEKRMVKLFPPIIAEAASLAEEWLV